MSNRSTMLSALRTNTLPILRAKGFIGRYPHFRRFREDRIDLISFFSNKWGGSFTVEVSAAFPTAADTNYKLYGNMSEETLNVSATNIRYRLPGMFDGWFYYSDVYAWQWRPFRFRKATCCYSNVNENEAAAFVPPKHYKQVQKFDAAVAQEISLEVNKQLETAFSWLERFGTSRFANPVFFT